MAMKPRKTVTKAKFAQVSVAMTDARLRRTLFRRASSRRIFCLNHGLHGLIDFTERKID